MLGFSLNCMCRSLMALAHATHEMKWNSFVHTRGKWPLKLIRIATKLMCSLKPFSLWSREINFQFENVSIMNLLGCGGTFKESYRVCSFVSCFVVRISHGISSFSLFIFVFLFCSLQVAGNFFSSFLILIPIPVYISFVDSLTLNGFQDVRFACVYHFSGLLNEGNYKLTSYKWFSIDQKINNGIQMTWQPSNSKLFFLLSTHT